MEEARPMTTDTLFLKDAYQTEATGVVTALTEDGGVVLDHSLFFPTGGGQPGDSGALRWENGEMTVTVANKGPDGEVVLRHLLAQLSLKRWIGTAGWATCACTPVCTCCRW